MQIDTDIQKIDEILTRGVGEFIDPDGSFRKKLMNNPKEIVIKFGVDPTRPDIHLGHAVVLRKLRQLQDLGCKVIFLIGDYTAQIGDPTGKSKVRPEIDQIEVERNMETYMAQVGKILKEDKNVFSWIRNSDWFTAINDIISPLGTNLNWETTNKVTVEGIDANSTVGKALIFEKTRKQTELNPPEGITAITLRTFLWTLKHITHSRLIDRDFFQDRLKNGQELFLHEMMYPVLQGIDSFAIEKIYGKCDLEVGGTDQTFNMIIGRDVMKMNKQDPQAVLAFKILTGLDGKEKMSKSLDNYIGITDEPNDMYGKVMSIPDSLIEHYFELCTFTKMDEIKEISEKLKNESVNPKDIKMDLALQITAIYHGQDLAEEAQKNWEATFSSGEIPKDVEHTFNLDEGRTLMDVVVGSGLVSSKTEYRRLLDAGAIEHMEDKRGIKDDTEKSQIGTYRIGKKRFLRIN